MTELFAHRVDTRFCQVSHVWRNERFQPLFWRALKPLKRFGVFSRGPYTRLKLGANESGAPGEGTGPTVLVSSAKDLEGAGFLESAVAEGQGWKDKKVQCG